MKRRARKTDRVRGDQRKKFKGKTYNVTPMMMRFWRIWSANDFKKGKQCAYAAGYTGMSAIADLRKKPWIKAQMAAHQLRLDKEYGITIDKLIKEYKLIAFGNLLNYIAVDKDGNVTVDLTNITPEEAAALSEISTHTDDEGNTHTKLKMIDKRGALQDLGKHLAMFTDVKVEGTVEELASLMKAARQRAKEDRG